MDPYSSPSMPGGPSPSLTGPRTSDSPPKYVQQFSATTEMILKRINSGAGTNSLARMRMTGTPPGYENMRQEVLKSMKTSMNTPLPPSEPPKTGGRRGQGTRSSIGSASSGAGLGTPTISAGSTSIGSNGVPGTAGKGKGARSKLKVGVKRKKKNDSESSSESLAMSGLGGDSESESSPDIIDFPKVTQSGRAVVKPTQFVPAVSDTPAKKRGISKKSQENALCKRCGRGHSPSKNMIVFCDGCNLGWHQMCHDPPITEDAVKDESSTWFCTGCGKKRGLKGGSPDKPQGVSWAGKSANERRAYLSTLPPNQLVNLLIQATNQHPHLPIFPVSLPKMEAYLPPQTATSSSSNTPNSQPQVSNSQASTSQPFSPSATAGLFARTERNPGAPINFIRKIDSGQVARRSPLSNASFPSPKSPQGHGSSYMHVPPMVSGAGARGSLESPTPESRESTPASPPYPKPGHGLMARLPADEEDIEWLVDNNDFEAFNHVVYDDQGGDGQVV